MNDDLQRIKKQYALWQAQGESRNVFGPYDIRALLAHIKALETVATAARALLNTTPGTLERTFAEADLIAALEKVGEVGDDVREE